MIALLTGRLIEHDGERAILDVSGVGYELTCSRNTLEELSLEELISLQVHTHVREDCIQLFGFSTPREKQMFLSLIKVNGVGPKMAVTILSGAPLDRIANWINTSDVKGLTTLPKVGKKTAEQMILSLKGKLAEDQPGKNTDAILSQVKSALMNLGYRASDVEQISDKLEDVTSVQDGVRIGLQNLSRRLLGEI